MFIRKFKQLALTASIAALLCPSAQAASTITIYASPAVANAVNDMVSDFIGVTNEIVNPATGLKGLGYAVSLEIWPDADAAAAIKLADPAGTDPTAGKGPDLFLSQSSSAPNTLTTSGLALDGTLINFAKDSLVIYSSADKQAALNTVLTSGAMDNKKLLLSSLKAAIPDPSTNDPYGLSAQKLLGGSGTKSIYTQLVNKGILMKVPNMVSSYAAVEVVDKVDGGADFGFTGLSQICSALDGTQKFHTGAKQWILPALLGLDVQLSGVTIANSANTPTSPTYSAAQHQELYDFVNFLTGNLTAITGYPTLPAGGTTEMLPLGGKSGKDTLTQYCYH
jgi:ABC-type molybdate transport system substrate-binding protein